MNLDNTDKKLLTILQSRFPLVARPYRRIAEMLVIEESEVVERVKNLKKNGVIRRIGPNFNPHAFGYKSTLIAANVPKDHENDVINFINSFANVTHNYKRDCSYNIWFTFTYKSDDELSKIISDLKEKYGICEIVELPSTKAYKLRTVFDVD